MFHSPNCGVPRTSIVSLAWFFLYIPVKYKHRFCGAGAACAEGNSLIARASGAPDRITRPSAEPGALPEWQHRSAIE